MMAVNSDICVVFDVYDTAARLREVIDGDLEAHGKDPQDFSAYILPYATQADLGGDPKFGFDWYQSMYNAYFGASPDNDRFHLIPRLTPIDPVHCLMRRLVEADIPIALLSNVSAGALGATIAAGALPDLPYTTVVQSCEVGMAKPDAAIFHYTQHKIYQALGRRAFDSTPPQLLLIDDSPTNVLSAQRLTGWSAVQFDPSCPEASVAEITRLHLPDLYHAV